MARDSARIWCGKRDDGGLDGREQDVLGQGVGHPRGGSDVGDVVRRTGARALQGLEPGSRDADHGVAAGQPDAAGRLTPERLGFDDLAELPVVGAVVPERDPSGDAGQFQKLVAEVAEAGRPVAKNVHARGNCLRPLCLLCADRLPSASRQFLSATGIDRIGKPLPCPADAVIGVRFKDLRSVLVDRPSSPRQITQEPGFTFLDSDTEAGLRLRDHKH